MQLTLNGVQLVPNRQMICAFLNACKQSPGTTLRLGGAWILGLAIAWCNAPQERENAIVWGALALALAIRAILLQTPQECPDAQTQERWSHVCAWGMILFGLWFVLNYLPTHLAWSGTLCCIFLAGMQIYFCGLHKNQLAALGALSVVALPLVHLEKFSLLVSYPLRLISTQIAVSVLHTCGVDTTAEFTVIHVGEASVAITDACSGIDQLSVIFLLGFLVVQIQHKTLWCKLLHYSSLIFLLIAANSLRLMLIIGLYFFVGEAIFYDPWHSLLGELLVFEVGIGLWLVGFLFPEKIRRKQENTP